MTECKGKIIAIIFECKNCGLVYQDDLYRLIIEMENSSCNGGGDRITHEFHSFCPNCWMEIVATAPKENWQRNAVAIWYHGNN